MFPFSVLASEDKKNNRLVSVLIACMRKGVRRTWRSHWVTLSFQVRYSNEQRNREASSSNESRSNRRLSCTIRVIVPSGQRDWDVSLAICHTLERERKVIFFRRNAFEAESYHEIVLNTATRASLHGLKSEIKLNVKRDFLAKVKDFYRVWVDNALWDVR